MTGRPSFWKTGYFDVPITYSEEQVRWIAPKYLRRFGEYLELEGFTVLQMLPPQASGEISQHLFSQPDTKRWTIFARVTRQPQTIHVDIPDYAVPEMEKVGLTLQE